MMEPALLIWPDIEAYLAKQLEWERSKLESADTTTFQHQQGRVAMLKELQHLRDIVSALGRKETG